MKIVYKNNSKKFSYTNNYYKGKCETFTDKICYLKKADYNNNLKTYCADKINLRNYCKEKLGVDLCPKILKIYNNANEITYNDLPEQFVLKCNHGSSMNIICDDKTSFDFDKNIEQLDYWNKTNFTDIFKKGEEYHYDNIVKKIFMEEYLNIKNEYKVWCFNGVPKFVQGFFYDNLEKIIYKSEYKRQFSNHCVFLDKKFKMLKHKQFYIPRIGFREISYLKHYYKKLFFDEYNKLFEYAEKLAKDFIFVRVDFYLTKDDKIYLSELTFTPSAGYIQFNNINTNLLFGSFLKLPENVKNN